MSELCGVALAEPKRRHGCRCRGRSAEVTVWIPTTHWRRERLVDIEHKADAAERAVTARVLRVSSNLANSLCRDRACARSRRATDRLASFGHFLREHTLAELAA